MWKGVEEDWTKGHCVQQEPHTDCTGTKLKSKMKGTKFEDFIAVSFSDTVRLSCDTL